MRHPTSVYGPGLAEGTHVSSGPALHLRAGPARPPPATPDTLHRRRHPRGRRQSNFMPYLSDLLPVPASTRICSL